MGVLDVGAIDDATAQTIYNDESTFSLYAPMNLLLIESNLLFREGLKHLLASTDSSIRLDEATDGEAGAMLIRENVYDIILFSLQEAGATGIDAFIKFKHATSPIPIVILSGDDNPLTIRSVIREGAAGFVPKSTTPAILTLALKLSLAGGIYLPRSIVEYAGNEMPATSATPSILPRLRNLSKRQREVLQHVVQGKGNKVIARQMGISEGAVKQHLAAALQNLGAKNRTEAAYLSMRDGLFSNAVPES